MFEAFFVILKNHEVPVTPGEWLSLQEALDKGLCGSSLSSFYSLSRMLLVKRETDYDKFDSAFEEYFNGIRGNTPLTARLLEWLDKPDMNELLQQWKEEKKMFPGENPESKEDDSSKEEIEERMRKRLEEQTSEHNGGDYWIGTMGKSIYGNTGAHTGGIRAGGKSGHQSAFAVMGEHRYKDFRDDRIIDNRQFQQVLRRLRQYSSRRDLPRTQLDLDGTISKTCRNGGFLQLVMEPPRKNAVKLLLLMDSGGTMLPYSSLMNELFQAVSRSNHFKETRFYYFHNCIYGKLYNTPACDYGDWIETEWLFHNLKGDTKVVIVGDAAMAPEELFSPSGNYRGPNDGLTGFEWMQLLKECFKKSVWLNPKMAKGNAPWRESETAVKEIFSMYPLTVKGLKEAMKELMRG